MMEKTFVVTQKANGFEPPQITLNNIQTGEIILYPTCDIRVSLMFIRGKFEWPNRNKTEVFRCAKCRHFILPGYGKIDKKTEAKYHPDCFRNSKLRKETFRKGELSHGSQQVNGNGAVSEVKDIGSSGVN